MNYEVLIDANGDKKLKLFPHYDDEAFALGQLQRDLEKHGIHHSYTGAKPVTLWITLVRKHNPDGQEL